MATRKKPSLGNIGGQKRPLSYEKLMSVTGGKTLDEISEDEWYDLGLHKLGFGSWLGRNALNLGQVALGTGLSFINPAIGVPMVTSGVTGMASDVQEQKNIKEQNVTTQQQQRDLELQNLNNQIRNNPNYTSNLSPVMAYGGTTNYEGQTHEGVNGGIPIDAIGNPVKGKPTALVENKEVGIDLGPELGTYVFSDRLLLNDKRSFAKEARRIQNKYKLHAKKVGGTFKVTDPISIKGYNDDMAKLIEKQEVLRDAISGEQGSPTQDMAASTIQGVPVPDESVPMAKSGIYIKPSKRGTFKAQATRMGMSVQEVARHILAHPEKYSSAMRKKANFARNFAKQDGGITTPYTGMTAGQTIGSMVPGVLSGVANIWRSRQRNPYESISLPTIQAQTLNLEPERAALREQGNVTEANISRNLLAAAPTAGEYMANMINANTAVRRGLGQELSRSYLNEAQYNAQAIQQADLANADIRTEEAMYNAQLENVWKERNDQLVNAGLSQIGQGITGAIGQQQQSRKDTMMLGMMNPDYEITQTIPEGNWLKRNFGRREIDINLRPEVKKRILRELAMKEKALGITSTKPINEKPDISTLDPYRYSDAMLYKDFYW